MVELLHWTDNRILIHFGPPSALRFLGLIRTLWHVNRLPHHDCSLSSLAWHSECWKTQCDRCYQTSLSSSCLSSSCPGSSGLISAAVRQTCLSFRIWACPFLKCLISASVPANAPCFSLEAHCWVQSPSNSCLQVQCLIFSIDKACFQTYLETSSYHLVE